MTTKTNQVSSTVPDWSRETPRRFWDPSRKLLRSIRDYQRLSNRQNLISLTGQKIAVIRHRFWSIATGADIPLNSQIGGGLLIPHPNGIVINPNAKIGPNCLIFQQVTIGSGNQGIPTVGGHVDIGAGAKILGSAKLGDHSKIGANSVVLCDVPPNATAVGIPAKIIDKSVAATIT